MELIITLFTVYQIVTVNPQTELQKMREERNLPQVIVVDTKITEPVGK
jgi:hypothetical protein